MINNSKVTYQNPIYIDFDNLCSKNDFAVLTHNYDRKSIANLVWSVNDSKRIYVIKAIGLQQKIENCSQDDFDMYMQLLQEQAELEIEYKTNTTETLTEEIQSKSKGYNTTEVSVLMYFICDKMGIYMRNDNYKNCDQKVAIPPIAKAFGWSESSFTDKLNLDFNNSATRKAMKKVYTDFKDFMPEISNEIKRVYDEHDE